MIVESPAKAKTINKYLGSDYIVKSSVGHVRDLPVSGGGKVAEKTTDKTKTAAKLTPEQKALVDQTFTLTEDAPTIELITPKPQDQA